MKKALRSVKAFTLIELLIVIVLATIATGIAYRIYVAATDSLDIVKEQNKNEMSVAISAENINNAIRYAASVFTMPESVFSTRNLDAGWNYFGIITSEGALTVRDGSTDIVLPAGYGALVFIEYMGPTGTASTAGSSQTLLYNDAGKTNDEYAVPESAGVFRMTTLCYDHLDTLTGNLIKYNLNYLPANGYDNIDAYTTSSAIRYIFGASYYEFEEDGSIREIDDEGNETGDAMFNIDAYLNGMNLMQVAFKGTASDPAVAIAFKNSAGITTTTETIKKKCNIVFVLDLSVSMTWDMNGNTINAYNTNESRVSILKKRMIEFMDMFKDYDTVNVSIVKFNATATYQTKDVSGAPKFLRPAKTDEYTNLTTTINLLSTQSGTNIGAGILGAIHALKRNSTLTNVADATNYVILITDGEVNKYLYTSASKTTATEGDYPTNSYVYGTVLSPYICKSYQLNGYTFKWFNEPIGGYTTEIKNIINVTRDVYNSLPENQRKFGDTEELQNKNLYNRTDENNYHKWIDDTGNKTKYFRAPYQQILPKTYTYTGDFFYFGDINYNTSEITQSDDFTSSNNIRSSNFMSNCLKALANPIEGTYVKPAKFWLVNLGKSTAVTQAEDIIYSFYGTNQGDYTEYFFNADDSDQLKSSFTTIGNTIVSDSGLITGPTGW